MVRVLCERRAERPDACARAGEMASCEVRGGRAKGMWLLVLWARVVVCGDTTHWGNNLFDQLFEAALPSKVGLGSKVKSARL